MSRKPFNDFTGSTLHHTQLDRAHLKIDADNYTLLVLHTAEATRQAAAVLQQPLIQARLAQAEPIDEAAAEVQPGKQAAGPRLNVVTALVDYAGQSVFVCGVSATVANSGVLSIMFTDKAQITITDANGLSIKALAAALYLADSLRGVDKLKSACS